MDLQDINRSVFFINTQALVVNGAQPENNTWVYKRAPEGYVYKLVHAQVSTSVERGENGIIAFYDGHVYTQWNTFPGVVNHDLLARGELTDYVVNIDFYFHDWECKEYTISIRSADTESIFKVCVIVYYYLKKMSVFERFKYAVVHPRFNRIKKAYATTLDPKDE